MDFKEIERNEKQEEKLKNKETASNKSSQQNSMEEESEITKEKQIELFSGKNVNAEEDISCAVNKALKEKKPEDIEALEVDISEKIIKYDIAKIDKKDIRKWVNQLKNNINPDESEQKKQFKELTDLFLFLAEEKEQKEQKKQGRQEKQKEDNGQAENSDLQYVAMRLIKASGGLLPEITDEGKIAELAQKYVDGHVLDELDDDERDANAPVNPIEMKIESLINQLEHNPLYDEEDKLVRKIEYYRTYEADVLNKERFVIDNEYSTMEKIKYRYRIYCLEKDLEYFRAKKKFVQAQMERIKGLKEEEAESAFKKLESLPDYKKWFDGSSLYKNNLFDLDEKKDRSEIRKADKTLQDEQVKAVRTLDKWLLGIKTKSYKEQGFIMQFMGCSIRERLSMYLCVEMNFKMIDESSLVFSQMNYSPNIGAIRKNLNNFFRQGIDWNKMFKAYELVTNRSQFIDEVIKKVDTDAISRVRANEEEVLRSKEKLARDEEDEQIANISSENIDDEIKKASQSLLGVLQDLKKQEGKLAQNGLLERELEEEEQGDDKYRSPEDLQRRLRYLRKLANRKASLEKNSKDAAAFAGLATCLEKYDTYNFRYGLVSSVSGAVRAAKVIDSFTPTSDSLGVFLLDGGDCIAAYASPIANMFKVVQNLYNLGAKGVDMSYSALTKTTFGALQATSTAGDTIYTAFKDIGLHTNLAGSYRQYRQSLMDTMKERTENGLPAMEFKLGRESLHTDFQLFNSAMTVSSSVIDYYNFGRSRKACNTILAQIENRREAKEYKVDKTYREEHYKKAMANLVKRMGNRKLVTTTLGLVSNFNGYLKYMFATPYIGTISSVIGTSLSLFSKGLNLYLKNKSDNHLVDEFLDLDRMLEKYREKHGEHSTDAPNFKEHFRRNAMLQLGFANKKSFLAHVRDKISGMMHNVLDNARKNKRDRAAAKPIETIVRALGLEVNYDANWIPKAKQIADKLAI